MAFTNPAVLVSTASGGGRTVITGVRRTGSTLDTVRTTAVDTNVSGAAMTGVPVTNGKAYRASYWIQMTGDAGAIENMSQARFKIKNGSTQLGSDSRIAVARSFAGEDYFLEFDWKATATETISTLNLTFQNEAAFGTLTVSVAATSFHGTVEDLGLASTMGL